MIRTLLVCLAPLLSVTAAWAADTTKVHIRIIDAATGQPTPAMACITDAATDAVRLPPDGRVCTRPSSVEAFVSGVDFNPDRNWIGPVRKTNGRDPTNGERSFVYEMRPSIPYWKGPVSYQVSGDFDVDLPAGRWRIGVGHGMEYVPAAEEFETTGSGQIEKTLELKRWINLPERGWWSGDVHVHHPTATEAQREYLLHYAVAEDVHMVNVLAMGDEHQVFFPQAGFGKKARVQRGDHALVSGQEDPRSTFGHIIGLNVETMVRDTKTYDFYDITFKGIHAQPDAVVGFAHFSWNGCDLPRGFPWFVTTGQIDFVEALQFSQVNLMDYAEYLNLGFRLTAAAGSDVPWGSTMGEVRTYAYTGPKFDPDAWFKAIKAGHTFVSNGPLIELTVDGQLPGSEVKLAAGKKVTIKAKAIGHPLIGRPKALTLVGNDGVIKEVQADKPENELKLELEHPASTSQWLLASVVCDNNALAHTTPVYVVVDGRPTWNPKAGPRIIDKQLAAIAQIEAEVAKGEDARAQGLRERLQKARAFYADLRKRMAE